MAEENRLGAVTCPACQTHLTHFTRIKVTGVIPAHELEDTPDKSEMSESLKWSNRFKCSCCGKALQLHLEVKILSVEEVTADQLGVDGEESAEFKPLNISLAEEELLRKSKESGILAAFTEAVSWKLQLSVRTGNLPVDMPAYFLSFIRKAVVARLQRPALEFLLEKFCSSGKSGYLQVWKSHGIGMIVVDGEIKAFAPMEVLTVRAAAKARRSTLTLEGVRVPRNLPRKDDWVRTKRGYVPSGQRVFLEALRTTLGPEHPVKQPVFRGR